MRILLALILSVILIGCSTPKDVPVIPPTNPKPKVVAVKKEDFTKLTNNQLCEVSFNRTDPLIDKEIKIRQLYCDQANQVCRQQGLRRNTLAMIDCVYHYKITHNQSPNVKYCFQSGIDEDDIDGMTGCLIERAQLENSKMAFGS